MEEAFWLKNKILKKGELIELKWKIYKYYNQKGKLIKELSKPIEKKFIKEITQKEYESKFPNKFIIDLQNIILGVEVALFCLIFKIPIPDLKTFGKTNEKNILEELEVDENF